MSKRKALSHQTADSVAVAIEHLTEGDDVDVAALEGDLSITVSATETIPLGHKIALGDIGKGADVIKYGEVIGRAMADIRQGEHVHTHNVKGLRWQTD